MKCFSVTKGSNIFRVRSNNYILAERFSQHQPGACNVNPLLRNLGYNNNSTQNQNVVQPTVRNLLGISSVNIKFS